jgi:acyl-CoA thioesterase-2
MSVPIPENPLDDLLRTLNLSKLESAASGEDRFEGPSQWMPHGRIYGGQVLAQSLVAATKTIDTEGIRNIHSLHGYFLRPGDIELPIIFSVDRLRDGRSFSTRRVQAFQNDLPIFSMIASFQDTDPGLDHQDEFPQNIPDPESLPTAAELLGESEHPVVQYWAKARPFDLRHVTSPIFFKVEGEHVAHQAVWIKSLGELPDDQNIHRAAIAYASDYTILESIYRRHGIAWAHRGLKSASLDHAMWFHRPFRADEWLLYAQETPSAASGRAFATGSVFTSEGKLAVTVVQEGLIRPPR